VEARRSKEQEMADDVTVTIEIDGDVCAAAQELEYTVRLCPEQAIRLHVKG
jgi:hypothetical protein